jgi:hypothetical protein
VALSPEPPPVTNTAPTLQVTPAAPEPEPVYETVRQVQADEEELLEIDWVSVVLGLMALLFVGGLVIFWFFIYLRWTNPVL